MDSNDPKTQSPGEGWVPAFPGSTDWIPPSDKNIPYQVNGDGTPTIGRRGMPGVTGHKSTVDGAKVRAQAAAAHQASEAYSQGKAAAQRQKDTANSQPQHSTVAAQYTPAPRKKGK